MNKKFLPIGTVVLLKNGTKKIMITGYLPTAKDKPGNVYDYSACIFPEGVISSDQTVVFNHNQINDIISEGYSNEETTKFLEAMNELIQRANIEQPAENAEPEMPVPAEERLEEVPAEIEMPAPAEEEPVVEMPVEAPQEEPVPEEVPQEEPVQEEQPVDMSAISNANPNNPVGIDDIKPFSE